MPIVSKYKNEQFDALMNDLITALEKHKAPVDLSLMVLGNLTTNIINGMAPAQRQAITERRSARTGRQQRREHARCTGGRHDPESTAANQSTRHEGKDVKGMNCCTATIVQAPSERSIREHP